MKSLFHYYYFKYYFNLIFIVYGEDPTNELRYILLLGITIFDWPWYAQDNENTKPQQVLYHVAYNE